MAENSDSKGLSKEELARLLLEAKNQRLAIVVKQLAEVTECLCINLTAIYVPGNTQAVQEYLSWLGRVEAIGNLDINGEIARSSYRKAFSEGPNDPYQFMPKVKELLARAKNQLTNERDALGLQIQQLEDQVHRLEVDRLTVEYGRDSVRLAKEAVKEGKESVRVTWINIRVSIIVAAAVLFFSLMGTVLYDSFKMDVDNWVRHLFRRPPIEKTDR
jgi:hypothetical protein